MEINAEIEKKVNINPFYEKIIHDIINSEDLKKRLEIINENYNNLKQENLIRNYILETLNDYFDNEGLQHLKAFAEHPRINLSRVDLSIVDSNSIVDGDNKENSYKIEFKYQFSGDNKNMTKYKHVIKKDFEDRKSSLFILIIAQWDKPSKKDFDEKWGISSKLNRYISKNNDCKQNIKNTFQTFPNSVLIEYEEIKIEKPFNMEYHFYVLKRV